MWGSYRTVRIMSISATLALSSSEDSKEDILEAMPGLNYDSEQSVACPQYCITLGAGPQWWS